MIVLEKSNPRNSTYMCVLLLPAAALSTFSLSHCSHGSPATHRFSFNMSSVQSILLFAEQAICTFGRWEMYSPSNLGGQRWISAVAAYRETPPPARRPALLPNCLPGIFPQVLTCSFKIFCEIQQICRWICFEVATMKKIFMAHTNNYLLSPYLQCLFIKRQIQSRIPNLIVREIYLTGFLT